MACRNIATGSLSARLTNGSTVNIAPNSTAEATRECIGLSLGWEECSVLSDAVETKKTLAKLPGGEDVIRPFSYKGQMSLQPRSDEIAAPEENERRVSNRHVHRNAGEAD
jgi:hypothetical protein